MNPYPSQFKKVRGGFSLFANDQPQGVSGLGDVDVTSQSILTQQGQVAADVAAGLLPASAISMPFSSAGDTSVGPLGFSLSTWAAIAGGALLLMLVLPSASHGR